MRKKLLSLLSLGLLAGACAFAQTDLAPTYIQNADFSSTDGWTSYKSADYTNTEMGLIGTLVVNSVASTTDATHTSDMYCAGVSARWNTNYAAWQQTTTVNLPAGDYILIFDVENPGNSNDYNMGNLTYVKVGDATFNDEGMTAAKLVGATGWVNHTINFSVTETQPITISFGYQNNENKGSGDTPELFFANLQLFKGFIDKTALNEAIANATALASNGFENGVEELNAAIATAQAVADDEDVPFQSTVTNAINALNAAVNAYYTANAWFADGKGYYLYNVGGDGFITASASWGTKAAIGGSFDVALARTAGTNDVYSISTNSAYSGKYIGANGFMDSGKAEWTFGKVANGVYTVKNGDNYLMNSNVHKVVELDANEPATDDYKWMVFTKETLAAYAEANATEANPVNMTAFITNPDFYVYGDEGTKKGWTNPGEIGGVKNGGNDAFFAMEIWHNNNGASKTYQTLTNMPNGKYALHVQGFQRKDNETENDGSLYINLKKAPLQILNKEIIDSYSDGSDLKNAAHAIFDGEFTDNVVTAVVTDGTLEIGVEYLANVWVVFDNFALYYLGEATVADVWADYNAVKSALVKGTMSADVAAAQTAADDAWTAAVISTSVDDVKAAFNAREAAIAAAQASVDTYVALATAIVDAKAFVAANEFLGAAAFNSAIADAEAAYTAGTLADNEIADAVADLAAAKTAYVLSQGYTFSDPANITCLWTNMSFEDNVIEPWVRNQWGQTGVKPVAECPLSDSEGDYVFLMQNSGDSNAHNFKVNRNITLPAAGWYTLSAVVGAANQKPYIKFDNKTVSTEEDCTDPTVGIVLETAKIYFEANATVEIAAGSYNAFRVDNFVVKYYGMDITLDENDTEFAYEAGKYNVTLTRTFNETATNWNTICLPFAVEDVKATFGEDVEVAEMTAVSETTVTFEDVESLEAGKAYIIRGVTGTEIEITATNANVVAEPVAVEADGHTMVGVFAKGTISGGEYFIKNNAFYYQDTKEIGIRAFRAYLTVPVVPAGKPAMRILVNGEESGIATIVGDELIIDNGEMYNVMGQKVDNNYKGLVIKNGQKFINK